MKECDSFAIEYVGVRHLLEKAVALIQAAYEGLPQSCGAQIDTIDLGLQILGRVDDILKAEQAET